MHYGRQIRDLEKGLRRARIGVESASAFLQKMQNAFKEGACTEDQLVHARIVAELATTRAELMQVGWVQTIILKDMSEAFQELAGVAKEASE